MSLKILNKKNESIKNLKNNLFFLFEKLENDDFFFKNKK
jgi:hypothetical protein